MHKKSITTEKIDGTELDVFSSPEITTSIIGENVVDFYPLTTIVENSPIKFDIPETITQMTDPIIVLC